MKLGPTTIIPADLYVERSADRQLRAVIEGMGRPGYVLVARQMGKTNLLLNARRTMENNELAFVYVDLSAQIESIGAYYRLVLSTAAHVHPELFASRSFDSSIEYTAIEFEKLLRTILRNTGVRLVLVLDEIDSLRGYSFSDHLFSQIS